MNKLIGLFVVALLMISCGGEAQKASENNEESAEVVLLDGPEYFGEKISTDGAISMSALMEQLKDNDSIQVTLQAEVEGVCQAKGCWMNLVSDEMADAAIFVKFKDYGFFMPKDIAGREVIANGYVYKEMTSVDELRHYAEDAGASKEEIAAITEPKAELKFMARGVKLLAEK